MIFLNWERKGNFNNYMSIKRLSQTMSIVGCNERECCTIKKPLTFPKHTKNFKRLEMCRK